MLTFQKNAIGASFVITLEEDAVVVDISTATTKNFIFKKPDGTLISRAASFVTSGTDGKLRYITIALDLNQTGQWELQVELVTTGYNGRTAIGLFYVGDNLE